MKTGKRWSQITENDEGEIFSSASDRSCRVETAGGRLRRLCHKKGESYFAGTWREFEY